MHQFPIHSFFHRWRRAHLYLASGRTAHYRVLLWLVLMFSVAGCNFGRGSEATPVPLALTPNPLRVLHTVERGAVVEHLRFSGRVTLATQEEIFFGRNGRIGRVYVESGAWVTPDTPIAELDLPDLAFNVEDAELQVALAQERLAEAEETWAYNLQNAQMALQVAQEQLTILQSQPNRASIEVLIQQLQVDQARLALERLERGLNPTYELELARAQLGLRQARAALDSAQLYVPFEGEVRFYDTLTEGTAAVAYEPVAQVVRPDAQAIEANLVSSDLEYLFESMPVEIYLTNQQAISTTGEISILPQPFGRGASSATRIEFDQETASPLFRPGAAVTIIAELARAEDTLWIPPDALHGFSDNYYVVVWEEDTEREIPIQLGLQNNDQVAVTGNLQPGQQLVAR